MAQIKKKEFRSRDFFIDNKSLIPRPETELLIDPIIKIFKNKSLFFLDVGVGSGCITYSILNEIKQSRGLGIDISKKSLINAKINLKKFKNRTKLMKRSIDDITHTKFDLIVSNPPYIVKREINRLSQDIKKYEPRIALDGGNDGLDVVKKVIYKAKEILKINGKLAIEIGNGQSDKISRELKKNNFKIEQYIRDYKENIRCLISTFKR